MGGAEVLGHPFKDPLGRGAIIRHDNAQLCFCLGRGNSERHGGDTKKYTQSFAHLWWLIRDSAPASPVLLKRHYNSTETERLKPKRIGASGSSWSLGICAEGAQCCEWLVAVRD